MQTPLEKAQIAHLEASTDKINLEKKQLKKHPLLHSATWATIIGGLLALSTGLFKYSDAKQSLDEKEIQLKIAEQEIDTAKERAKTELELSELRRLKAELEVERRTAELVQKASEIAESESRLETARSDAESAIALRNDAEQRAAELVAETDRILNEKRIELAAIEERLAAAKDALAANRPDTASEQLERATEQLTEQKQNTEEAISFLQNLTDGRPFRIHIFARSEAQARGAQALKEKLEENGYFVYAPKFGIGNAPPNTEVRCFYLEEKPKANLITELIREAGIDSRSRPSYVLNDKYGNAKGHIEIWLKESDFVD